MDILLWLHSYVRWLVVLVAIIAAVKFAVGWLQKQKPAAMDRGLMSAFSGLVDLQVLLGLVLLIGSGIYSMQRIEHAGTMIIAAVLAHLPMLWRKGDSPNVLRNNFLVIVAVMILIVAGVTSLVGNRWILR